MVKFIISMFIFIPVLIPTVSYTYTYSRLVKKHSLKRYSIETVKLDTVIHFDKIKITAKVEKNYSFKGIPYSSHIIRNSKRYSLEPKLVTAIIKQESRFNPEAVSNMNAIGLMQIVPDRAGQEMNRIIFNNNAPIEDSLLLEPSFNIRIGCAYLHYLEKNYLNKIRSNVSKQYCMIASYNTGVGNLIKAILDKKDREEIRSVEGYASLKRYQQFLIEKNKAIEKINNMSDSEVVELLNERLPYNETVIYLNNIISYMNEMEIQKVAMDNVEVVAMN